MRLLNTRTITLATFYDDFIPPYTILSHTWSSNELTFQDISDLQRVRTTPGFQKISDCCWRSLRDGYEWTWCDTVCIDKTSSAELSEAINSMWKWYQGAEVCYVFLEDLDCQCNREIVGEKGCAVFQRSRWFTRGWTLQELIAPPVVEFYNGLWEEVGTRLSLCDIVAEITGINVGVLKGVYVGSRCIAERMSWASNRKTTRSEDRAYSLMGIFDVNMPMLYGEGGEKAFLRLQEHILKDLEDYSLFAWTQQSSESSRGMLAYSPDEFNCRDPTTYSDLEVNPWIEHDYLGTNTVVETTTPTISESVSKITSVARREMHVDLAVRKEGRGLLAYLNCRRKKDKHMLCIYLEQDFFHRPHRYARVTPKSIVFDSPEVVKKIRPPKSSSKETLVEMGFYSYTALIVKDPSFKPWRQVTTKLNPAKFGFSIKFQSFDKSIIQLGEQVAFDRPAQPIKGIFLKLSGIIEVKTESSVKCLILYGTTIAVGVAAWCHIETNDLEIDNATSCLRRMQIVTDRASRDVGDSSIVTASIRKRQTDTRAPKSGERSVNSESLSMTYVVNILVSEKGKTTINEAAFF